MRDNKLKFIRKFICFCFFTTVIILANNKIILEAKDEYSSNHIENEYSNIDFSKLHLTYGDLKNIVAIYNNPDDIINEMIIIGESNFYLMESSALDYVSIQSSGGHYNIFGRNLTLDEILILITNPQHIFDFIDSVDIAMSKTNQIYGSSGDGSIGNSFLHAYWNDIMVKKVGLTLAEAFATAHENYVGNPQIHKYIDLDNNEKGRQIASQITNLSSRSNDYLANVVVDAVNNGHLRYILFNYKYVHTIVYYDTHTDVIYDCGDFYAYTNKVTPANLPKPIIIDYRTNPGPIFEPDGGELIYVD